MVGTVFKVATNGVFTLLHTFAAADYDPGNHFTNANGATPFGGLSRAHDGSFYGTTRDGGGTGSGTIFRISTNGTFTSLFNFAVGNDNEMANRTNSKRSNAPLIRAGF